MSKSNTITIREHVDIIERIQNETRRVALDLAIRSGNPNPGAVVAAAEAYEAYLSGQTQKAPSHKKNRRR
jgi:hypothetical protein